MFSSSKKIVALMVTVLMVLSVIAPASFAKDGKIGYVDLRRAFYDYEKTKTMESNLNTLTEESQAKRTDMINAITKLREAAEMAKGDALKKNQAEIDKKLTELQEFDRTTRQELLNKKNDMFREVIDDIQKVVDALGKSGKYDYILDSRNIMYADEAYDLTDEVLKKLNK